jgi:hypothetical protein
MQRAKAPATLTSKQPSTSPSVHNSYMASFVNRRTLFVEDFFFFFVVSIGSLDVRFQLHRLFQITVAPSWLHHTAIVGLSRWSPGPSPGSTAARYLWPCAQETRAFPASALQKEGSRSAERS